MVTDCLGLCWMHECITSTATRRSIAKRRKGVIGSQLETRIRSKPHNLPNAHSCHPFMYGPHALVGFLYGTTSSTHLWTILVRNCAATGKQDAYLPIELACLGQKIQRSLVSVRRIVDLGSGVEQQLYNLKMALGGCPVL